MKLQDYLQKFVEAEGSDLFFTTGAPVCIKVHGRMKNLTESRCPPGLVEKIANSVMTPEQQEQFKIKPEMNLALSHSDLGRFRVNIFRQRNEVGMVIRSITSDIPSWQTLGLPEILTQLIMQKRGLILFVGSTGSGKSTSLASLIDYRNTHSTGHIITIEDPVEFTHRHKGCIINQREVGVDTDSYADALKNTLRQAPDVILIGEIRSQDTMEHAIEFAETGHLCLSTLHANNANQAIDRIINFFPDERHKQLFLDLSLNLKGIVSQRLIPTHDGRRVAAIEIMLNTPRIADLIKQGKPEEIKEVMHRSETQGMCTFDSALYKLYKDGKITLENALKNADSKNNLRLKINLEEGITDSHGDGIELDHSEDHDETIGPKRSMPSAMNVNPNKPKPPGSNGGGIKKPDFSQSSTKHNDDKPNAPTLEISLEPTDD